MSRNPSEVSVGGVIILLLVLFNAIVLKQGYTHEQWYRLLPVTGILLLAALFIFLRKKP